jgi:TRAP-type C4-dicarboxylate transport system substrate-binding protein
MNTISTGRRSRRVRLAAIAAILATASVSTNASATTEPPDNPDVDMAGNEEEAGDVEAITLTATYHAQVDRPRGQVIQRFAEEVDRASGGAIKIELTLDNVDSEQQWLDGDFDILLTPARTLDTMGVSTLDVLSLPFVVQDDDQADRVATSDVAGTMLAGLSAIDATGLALAPITQEHLQISGDEPLRSIDQLETGIRMFPRSDTVAALFEAMGGHVAYDLNDEVWTAAIESGEVLASEFPTALAAVRAELSTATNFTLFYDFGVVAIRNESLAELTDEQAEMLRVAGDATVRRQVDERIREEDAFAQACSDGATLTAAPNSLMGEIGMAVDDYIIEMLEDPATRELYDSVRDAAGKNRVPRPVECTWSETTEYTPPNPPSTAFPEGVYRVAGSSADELYVRGAPYQDAINNAVDYWEFTFEDGTVTLTRVDDQVALEELAVPYTVDDRGRLVTDGWTSWTWREVADGIIVEELPIDDPQALWDQWEVAASYGFWHLVRAE